jgi:flagellar hook-associated protein 1
MSTFGGLNTAYTGLVAARQGLNVVGQNIANVNTDGYTRQRISTSATGSLAHTGMLTAAIQVGQGVSVDGIARLGDVHLDARARATAAIAAYTDVRADAMSTLEVNLQEPGANGLSAQLNEFWAAWQDVANNPGEAASAGLLLAQAGVLTAQIAHGYQQVDDQWSQVRGDVEGMVAQVNEAAGQIAMLNGLIRSTAASGGSANELIDQRSALTTTIATLAGGTIRESPDGTVDVLIGGNAIVMGTTAGALEVLGSAEMAGVTGTSGTTTGPVHLSWASGSQSAAILDGGQLAGAISVLAAPADGGVLATAAETYNDLAVRLTSSVNGIHAGGAIADGTTGHEFFALDAALPAALGLSVLPTDANGIAAGKPGAGAYDGSIADAISQIGISTNSPDNLWSAFVTQTGAATKTELQRSTLADLASSSAAGLRLANSSVDLDEENVNLLSFQHAYQGAARVMTAIDEMLDTLINRTGIVGR